MTAAAPKSSLPPQRRTRGASILLGIFVFCILAYVLPPDSPMTLVLVDKTSVPRAIPYPLTIHLLLYALAGLGFGEVYFRRATLRAETDALAAGLLPEQPGSVISSDELADLSRATNQAGQASASFLADSILECLTHFELHRSVPDAHEILRSLTLMRRQRLATDYALVRYIIWAIPTFGFLGTVIGISGALVAMEPLFHSDTVTADVIAPVMHQLGMAFNTTIVALVFSALITWATQLSMSRESQLIDAASEYTLRHLLNRLYAPSQSGT